MRILAVVLLLVAAACGQPDGRPALVAFGHSWVAGEDGVKPWPERVADDIDRRLVDRSEGGTRSGEVLEAVESYTVEGGEAVVIEAALNDVRHGDAVDAYRENLTAMLAHLDGVDVYVVGEVPIDGWDAGENPDYNHGSDELLDAYNEASREVAVDAGATFVEVGGWSGELLGPDRIHPNDDGAALFADAVAGQVTATSE